MPTFGEEIKRERELRGIGLREVAEATKVNIRYLEAMERDDFEHLPGGVFNRGFVRAFAQFIGVDPDAMVNAYLMQEQAQNGQRGSTAESLLRGHRSSGKSDQGAERDQAADQPARPLLRCADLESRLREPPPCRRSRPRPDPTDPRAERGGS